MTGHELNFPLIADPDRRVATLYDMLHPNSGDTATVRSVFVIGADNKVKLMLTYPASTGRNFQELLRVIDSLQLTARHSVATPADWWQGEDVIIVPAVSDDDARKRFPGFRRQEAVSARDTAAGAVTVNACTEPDGRLRASPAGQSLAHHRVRASQPRWCAGEKPRGNQAVENQAAERGTRHERPDGIAPQVMRNVPARMKQPADTDPSVRP